MWDKRYHQKLCLRRMEPNCFSSRLLFSLDHGSAAVTTELIVFCFLFSARQGRRAELWRDWKEPGCRSRRAVKAVSNNSTTLKYLFFHSMNLKRPISFLDVTIISRWYLPLRRGHNGDFFLAQKCLFRLLKSFFVSSCWFKINGLKVALNYSWGWSSISFRFVHLYERKNAKCLFHYVNTLP